MNIKQSFLIDIAKNKEFFNFCKKKNPLKFKELYSEFLFVMSNKSLDFYKEFKGNINSYCHNVIYTIALPNSQFNYKNKLESNTQRLEQENDIPCQSETSESIYKLALNKAVELEDYWYNKRIFEYLADGYSVHQIHQITNCRLQVKEIYRVRDILKE